MNINVVYINNYMKYEFKDWKIHLHKHTDWGFERALSWRENGKRPKPNETSQMTLTTLKRLKTKTTLFFSPNFWTTWGLGPLWRFAHLRNVQKMERDLGGFEPLSNITRWLSFECWKNLFTSKVGLNHLLFESWTIFSSLSSMARFQLESVFDATLKSGTSSGVVKVVSEKSQSTFQYVSICFNDSIIQSFSTLRSLHRDVPNLQDGEKQKRDTKLHRQNVLVTTSKQMVQ